MPMFDSKYLFFQVRPFADSDVAIYEFEVGSEVVLEVRQFFVTALWISSFSKANIGTSLLLDILLRDASEGS